MANGKQKLKKKRAGLAGQWEAQDAGLTTRAHTPANQRPGNSFQKIGDGGHSA